MIKIQSLCFNVSTQASVFLVDDTEQDLLARRKLSKEEELLFSTMKSEKRRRQWLGCRVAIQELLGQAFDLSYLPTGKPILTNSKQHLSISHTMDYVAIAMDKERPIGIDIEKVSDKILTLWHYILNKEEQELFDVSDREILQIVWGAKEAVYKQFGEQKIPFFSAISITQIDKKNHSAQALVNVQGEQKKAKIHYEFENEYILVISY